MMAQWWSTYYDHDYDWLISQVRSPEAIAEQGSTIAKLLADAGIKEGIVLDAPCGAGAISLELATKHDYVVHGIDSAKTMIDIAQARCAEAGVSRATFEQNDIRGIEYENRFDAAINWFTSLGYTTHADDDVEMLFRIRAALKPGGVLLVDSDIVPSWETFSVAPYELNVPGGRVSSDVAFDRESHTITEQQVFETPFGQSTRNVTLRLYMADELAEVVERAGYSDVHIRSSGAPDSVSGCSPRVLITAIA